MSNAAFHGPIVLRNDRLTLHIYTSIHLQVQEPRDVFSTLHKK
jgi:hypothetical protein